MTKYCKNKNCGHKKTDHKHVGMKYHAEIECIGLAINKNRNDFKCYCKDFIE